MAENKIKRKRRARAKPKEKARQKQKQRQVVNVQVSSGGSGGGGTSFIPMPQAPAFDYNVLASLIRPANTVDMPIREAAPMPTMQVRPAEEPTLVEELPVAKGRKVRSDIGKSRAKKTPIAEQMSEREAGYETFPTEESDVEVRNLIRKQEGKAADIFQKYGGGMGSSGGPFM